MGPQLNSLLAKVRAIKTILCSRNKGSHECVKTPWNNKYTKWPHQGSNSSSMLANIRAILLMNVC